MGRSQDSFNKKEREKKKQKRKKEKAERKEQRKLESKKGQSLEEMFMYVDENGNLTSTPPDPTKKVEISLDEIQISVPKQEKSDTPDFERSGRVKFFNTDKGYGFITDANNNESIFVHANGLVDEIKDNDLVVFEVEKGPKGLNAINVRLQQ